MNEDELNEQDAINAIQEIVNIGEENGEQLLSISQQLNDINNHITNIDEYIITKQEQEDKKDEQDTEKITKESTEKNTKADTEESEETITTEQIYTEIQLVNDNLEAQINLLSVGIFAQGIIIGVLLLTIFWKRVFR